ncbi:MAG: hypothetical protein HYZ28_21115 [Myxococcales bacterium]|nr:hypothetical protein [Myxococcales bacterium]
MEAPRPDGEVIRATYRWLAHAPHGVSEVRAIRPGGAGILGIGFFDDEESFVRECLRANAIANVYVGIQPRPRRLLEMAANAIRPLKTGAGRKDVEVVTATVIDLDPVRPKDTASTEAELAAAITAGDAAAAWCEGQGLLRPRRMMSGNGAQLWFAVPPTALTEENREAVQANLRAFEAEVRSRVESEAIKVDSIHDLARIIKVIGTVSLKGEPSAERPHRTSVALDHIDRVEDGALAKRLLAPPPAATTTSNGAHRLPVLNQSPAATAKAHRTPEGEYHWESPVEMCGPVQRLWEQGEDDRSRAIFNMVRFFVHKGLGLDEITELVLEYDRRGLGKLAGRDGPAYIRQCYEKVIGTVREDGTVAPPCHSLQKLGYCRVNREPGARCEIYDYVFDIEKAVQAIPEDSPARELEYRLKPIFEAIAHRDPSMQGRYIDLLGKRFGLKQKDLRRSVTQAGERPHENGADASRAPNKAEPEDTIEGEVWEDTSCYYTMSARGETRYVSSFNITPQMRVETEDTEIILGSARTDKGTTVEALRLPLKAFHSKRDLIRHLPSADLQWTGSDNNVQGLLRVLARYPVPRRPGSTVLGDYKHGEHHLWLCPKGAITKDGFMNPSPVIYVPSGGSLDGRVQYPVADDDAFKAVADKVFEFLPRVNIPEVIVPVLGWFFAAPVKPRFMERVGSFPTLFIWGTQGSGKSSLVSDVFWPLSGIRDAEPYSATETEFALLKILTSTRSIPIFIDEYKPFDMPRHRLNTLHRYLRRLYRGETEERGRPDQTVNTYHLQAPLCVAGETRPTEAALLERILTTNPAKTTLEERQDFRAAFRELKALELGVFAPRYIQFCLGRDFDADLAVARAVAGKLLADRKVPIRVAENVTAMLLGVYLFEQFAEACGHALPADLGVREAVDAVLADVLETDHGVKNALDHFIDMLQVMAIQGELRHRVHYVFNDGVLFIHLESAYDSFRKHCKNIGYEGELVDLKALRRLIHENQRQGGYVTLEGERVYFGVNSNRRRAFGVDPTKTPMIDPESWPQEEEKDRGFGSSYSPRYGD